MNKFIRITKDVLNQSLYCQDTSNQNVLGWKIYLNYNQNQIDIVKVYSSLSTPHTHTILSNQFTIFEQSQLGQLDQLTINNQLHPLFFHQPGFTVPGYYYLAKDDYEFTDSYSDTYYFSGCHLTTMHSITNNNDFNGFSALKIECAQEVNNSNTGSFQVFLHSTTETPLFLIAIPCPPDWRPGKTSPMDIKQTASTVKVKLVQKKHS